MFVNGMIIVFLAVPQNSGKTGHTVQDSEKSKTGPVYIERRIPDSGKVG